MKKRILRYIIAALAAVCMSTLFIPVASATDIETLEANETIVESKAETVTETAEISKEDAGEIASEVIEVIGNTANKSEAIISLAEKLGITVSEAEAIINTVIEVGDEYAGDSAWWISFKNNVQSDIQFWAVAMVLVAAVLAIIGGIFVLLAKTNPTMKKAMWGMTESLKISDKMSNENSQTLGEIKKIFEESAKKEALFEQIIEKKEEYITELEVKIEKLEEASSVERANMVKAEMYNLRMLKLICDRTAMPLTDKATIDLFYAKGVEALKEELSEEDLEKIEKTMATLNTVGDKS